RSRRARSRSALAVGTIAEPRRLRGSRSVVADRTTRTADQDRDLDQGEQLEAERGEGERTGVRDRLGHSEERLRDPARSRGRRQGRGPTTTRARHAEAPRRREEASGRTLRRNKGEECEGPQDRP